jgi:hypothetical protein
MSESSSHHLTEEQLARYQDGKLPPQEASHVDACSECAHRLTELRAAEDAYRQYLNSIRGPALPAPPQPWRTVDSLIAQHEASHSRRRWRWWIIPALGAPVCLALLIGLVLRRSSQQPAFPAEEMLARSASMESPGNRMVSMRHHGRSLIRPAVLTSASTERDPELAHLAMLFTEARYNWQEPLSARSFQSWRSSLREKRDSVTVLHARGPETAYRIRTDARSGILHSAALTLRAKDLHPTQGTFQFQGEDTVEIEESDASLPPGVSRQPRPQPGPIDEPRLLLTERPASPADTLHVLAALNEIGADAGEPIEVSEDANHQVLVRAVGLKPDRAQQVAAAIKALPHVKFSMDAGAGTSVSSPQAGAPERSSSGMPASLRRRFEERLGGPVALQEMTDRVLEASGLAIARAHAIDMLATKFPPGIESALSDRDRQLLQHLHQTHVAALRDLAARIESDLHPLLPSAATQGTLADLSWQGQAPALLAVAQQVDDDLNRLLAGSYSDTAGEALLNNLAVQFAHLRQMVELQGRHAR